MTKFEKTTLDLLTAPLDRRHVRERTQSNRSFSYIEGWHAIAEANRIFGFDGWDRNVLEYKCVAETKRKIGRDQRDGYGVSYIVHARVRVGDIIRDGMGSGHGIDIDLGLAHESAIKEAETDAMKRALMTFGNAFGLALYDKDQRNVADVVINMPDEPDPDYQEEILTKMMNFIVGCKTKTALRKYWVESAAMRQKAGIIQNTHAYDIIIEAINDHLEKIDE